MLQQELQDVRHGRDGEHADSGSALSLSLEEHSVAHGTHGDIFQRDAEDVEVSCPS